jgi:hypothetical protein
MNDPGSPYITTQIEPDDVASEFSCGKHALDDYFKRHALSNDRAGIGRAYVLRGDAAPKVRGFYTLSMALAESAQVADVLAAKLPKYPMPVALIGRLAVDHRMHGRRIGEALLIDALCRIVDAASIVGCIGVVVDAKDEDAERFYAKYDFAAITEGRWPHRMFLPLETAKAALSEP